MDKLIAAAASVVIAYIMPVGARAAPNMVVAVASNSMAARDAVNVPGTKLVVVPPRPVPSDGAKVDGYEALRRVRSENAASSLNWMQDGGG
jgi:hypothetical protein